VTQDCTGCADLTVRYREKMEYHMRLLERQRVLVLGGKFGIARDLGSAIKQAKAARDQAAIALSIHWATHQYPPSSANLIEE